MSRFKQYLVEAEMTVKKALEVFGISADKIADKIALKSLYRKLSMENHPDRGGDVEIAKDINTAYGVLSKASVEQANSDDRLAAWKKRDQEEKKVAEQIKQSLLSNFHPEVFTSYFEQFSNGAKFEYEITKAKQSQPGFTVEFFTKNKDSIFTLKISADMTDIFRSKGLGSGDKYSYTVYTEAYGFHLNKKQKMSKSDWGFTRDHSFFRKPEQLFPKKKMQDIFSGKTSNRAFSKRDMIAYMTKKLKADWDGEWLYIPLGEDYKLLIYRTTFMRQGTWSSNGIYLKHSRISQPRHVSFMEEEQTAQIFEKIQKEVMKVNGEAKVKKTEQLLSQAYEAYKKFKGW